MRRLRAQVAWVAAGWLTLHLALFVAVPTSLCSTGGGTSAKAACKCAHAQGDACPMHHPRAGSERADTRWCACANADPMLATVACLLGPAAVLAPPVPTLATPAAVIC